MNQKTDIITAPEVVLFQWKSVVPDRYKFFYLFFLDKKVINITSALLCYSR